MAAPFFYSITSSASASSVGRDVEAERLGGLEVDDEIELGGPYDGEVGGLLALENVSRIDAGLTIGIRIAGPVTEQATGHDGVAGGIACRQRMASRQRDELLPV